MSTENIDWSKAPEGTTHFDPESRDLPWEKREGDIWFYWDRADRRWESFNKAGDSHLERYPQLVAKPELEALAAWSGEGLPPIGSVCEMLSHGEEESEWIEVQILAHTKIYGEDHAVFQYEEHVGTGSVHGSCFRPIRTPQEREVDLVLSEIEALYAEGGPAAIYDAGYRKVDPAGAQP